MQVFMDFFDGLNIILRLEIALGPCKFLKENGLKNGCMQKKPSRCVRASSN